MTNVLIPLGSFTMLLAIAAGAFAAHGLKDILSIEYITTFKTAANYQMIHGTGLILIGILNKQATNNHTRQKNTIAAFFMLLGIILFSGSLYLLTLTNNTWLGMITPFGGICFLIAWLIITYNYLPEK